MYKEYSLKAVIIILLRVYCNSIEQFVSFILQMGCSTRLAFHQGSVKSSETGDKYKLWPAGKISYLETTLSLLCG